MNMSQNKIVTLIDMDCFYCQVEVRADPTLQGKPVAVVQYNTWKGGGIIAVNYEARNAGVTRGMRGDEALKRCPGIQLVSVPEVRGKADLTRYRDAGREVVAVLCEFSSCVEKASIDEAYVDLTEIINRVKKKVTIDKLKSTFVVGYSSDQQGTEQWLNDIYTGGINDESLRDLARAAVLVEEIRAAILTKTSFHCSAGISHNKILAKLACGIHKPNRQTVLPISSIMTLYSTLPLKKIKNLGGKFGDAIREQLDVTTMGQVTSFSLKELQQKFGDKNGLWLYNIARGIDTEPVKPRLISKSIGCCKNFKGPSALTSKQDVKHWLTELAAEIIDRIQDDLVVNKRKATLLVVSAHQEVESASPFSRSTALNNYDQEEIIRHAYTLLCKCNKSSAESLSWSPPLKFLGLSVGKFVEVKDSEGSLLNFFKPVQRTKNVDEPSISPTRSTENIPNPIFSNDTNSAGHEKSDSSIVEERFVDKLMVRSNSSNSDPVPDQDFSDTEVYDYRNSFFCRYFARKRFQDETASNPAGERIQVQVDVHVSNDDDNTTSLIDMKRPTSSPSKCQTDSNTATIISDTNIASTSRDDFAIPSCSHHRVLPLKTSVGEKPVVNSEPDNTTTEDSTFDANELTELCPQCNQNIKLVEFLEHLDHHVACKLQEELNGPAPRAITVFDTRTKPAISKNVLSKPVKKFGGEKRKYNKSKNRTSPAKRSVPITSFFSVKQQLGGAADD